MRAAREHSSRSHIYSCPAVDRGVATFEHLSLTLGLQYLMTIRTVCQGPICCRDRQSSPMASDSAELRVASPSAQPLLHNHLTSDFDISRAKSPRGDKDFSTVTERALEDGDTSDSDSDASLGPHPTFWGRCLMAVRRRRPSLSRADYETGRLPAFEKRRRAWRAKKYVWRKRDGAWACLGILGFVVFFL